MQYTYIVNKNKKLLGVIPLRELFFSSKNTLLIEILHKKIITIPIISNIEQIRNYFNDHSYLAFPVVDENHKLLGVLKRDSVEHFLKRETEQEFFEINRDYGGRRIPFYAYTTKICKKTIVAQYKYFIKFYGSKCNYFLSRHPRSSHYASGISSYNI